MQDKTARRAWQVIVPPLGPSIVLSIFVGFLDAHIFWVIVMAAFSCGYDFRIRMCSQAPELRFVGAGCLLAGAQGVQLPAGESRFGERITSTVSPRASSEPSARLAGVPNTDKCR